MRARHRRMAIALMTRWFEHVQVGGAFNDTVFAIFSKDSPLLGRFADGENSPTVSYAFVSSAPPDFNPLLLRVIVSHLKGARLRGPRYLTSTVSGVQRQRWFGGVTIRYPRPP